MSTDCSLTQALKPRHVSAVTPSFIAEKTGGPILALINWNSYIQRLQVHPGNTLVIQIFMLFAFVLFVCTLER